eukprot:jgi/Psemu1/196021/e_gw1.181.4.1
MKSDNGRAETGSFNRWVMSLNREELLDAMAFTFQPNTNNISQGSTTTPNSVSSYHKSTCMEVDSHEYELLLLMVQLQPPPPTPVHPRATGYKSMSQKGARLDYFYKEEEHLRWTKPRLFRWSEKQEQFSFLDGKNRGGRATRGRVRNRGRTKHNNSNGSSGTNKARRFNVFARKKVGPWGDIYSLGCTREQNDADFELIEGTRLGRRRIDGKYNATACFVCSGELDEADDCTTNHTAASILKMLWIASRGQFFQQDAKPPFIDSKRSTQSEIGISFCAPWLQPTERWFSLGMYLASRFQMALWESYQKNQSSKRKQQQQQQHHGIMMHPGRIIRQGGNWHGYEETMLRDALVQAIHRSLKVIVEEEQNSSNLKYLRDGTLWSMLESNCVVHYCDFVPHAGIPNLIAKGHWKSAARDWSLIRLVDIHSAFKNRFKCLVNDKLEEELIAQMQQTVFEDDELERNSGREQKVADTSLTLSKKRRNRTKRQKKKKRHGSEKGQMNKNNPPIPFLPPRIEKGDDDVANSSDLSSVAGDEELNVPLPDSRLDFPQNSTPVRERNRNIIFALCILEEITENVFAEVGLQSAPEPEKSDLCIATTAGDQSRLSGLKLQKQTANVDAKSIAVEINQEPAPGAFPSNEDALEALEHFQLPQRNLGKRFPPFTIENEIPSNYIYHPFVGDADIGLNCLNYVGEETTDWSFPNRYQSRDCSIWSNFFLSQNEKVNDKEDGDGEETLMVASTAASIASSTYNDTTFVAGTGDEIIVPDNIVEEGDLAPMDMSAIQETDDSCSNAQNVVGFVAETDHHQKGASDVGSSVSTELDAKDTVVNVKKVCNEATAVAIPDNRNDSPDITSDSRSPTLQAPVTPPPTLSPMFSTLDDLKKLEYDPSFTIKRIPSLDLESAKTAKPLSGPGSLPPTSPGTKKGLVSSWSREDLRIASFRDDHNMKNDWRDRIKCRSLEASMSKPVATKTLAQPINSHRDDVESFDHGMHFIGSSRQKQDQQQESCAQSETAMDAHQGGEHQDWYKEVENQSLTKDETTTIISGISHRGEAEELHDVQEERNYFRDISLTLGAEVAKLKVMLATQQAAAAVVVDFQEPSFGYPKMNGHGSFDPHSMQHSFHGAINAARPGPMSDAGFHRYGDHESLLSDDDIHDTVSRTRETRVDPAQRLASSQTIASHNLAESDVSVDCIKVPLSDGQVPGSMPVYDSFHYPGLQSRLTKDVLQFLSETNTKMRKLDGRRQLAVERFSRLVKTVWPRAQVKLYGSYISGLCLPTSDLDFVVCLPAVHKKDLALAPGVLEGRNAFNETSQKLLARELKGESWIDPRSIKVIEHTAMPVIKVSTKDTRARMIKLDISFDGPEHHGLEANRFVAQTLEELPLIRPLMLVLKQFLLHRGLLTAYTGGLTSYCLFLMLARYLQEQPLSNNDCGSLLMGFLDFYGNHFDPRAIGISVGCRQFFARANIHTAAAGYEPTAQPFWNGSRSPHKQHVVINNLPQNPTKNPIDFRRRNSFSDAGSVDDSRRRPRPLFSNPPVTSGSVTKGSHRFSSRAHTLPMERNYRNNNNNNNNNRRATYNNNNFSGFEFPSTFDPLFVEDPLSATNNVGRNAFRINQVQRAFSDAHRALIASLDWDIQSAEASGKYPLLKCLLGNQREDVLYGL